MQIGFLVFPGVTQLDLTGPLQVLSRLPNSQCVLVGKSLEPAPSDTVLTLTPTCTFSSAPPLDTLCVPGGFGVEAALNDAETLDYVRTAAAGAQHVTSVCTGALLLGAAGLLRGKRATTHWAYTSLLPLFGAVHVDARVVRDGRLMTGGGVTAGIDFAFVLLQEIAGPQVAAQVQLSLEYDPQPPLQAGRPDTAKPQDVAALQQVFAPRVAILREALRTAATSHAPS